MAIVKFETTDNTGFHWEKEGDFGVVAVGRIQHHGGKELDHPDVEVDFTATTTDQLAYLIATQLVVVHQTSPIIAQRAIGLFEDRIKYYESGGKEGKE